MNSNETKTVNKVWVVRYILVGSGKWNSARIECATANEAEAIVRKSLRSAGETRRINMVGTGPVTVFKNADGVYCR